jgi:hypothetical protein
MKGDRDSWLEPVSLSFFTIEGTMEKKLQDCDPWEAHDVIYMLISLKISQNTLWFGSWLLIINYDPNNFIYLLIGIVIRFFCMYPHGFVKSITMLPLHRYAHSLPPPAHWVTSRVAVRHIQKWPSRLCSLCCWADRDREEDDSWCTIWVP